jgi:hypothetical protein
MIAERADKAGSEEVDIVPEGDETPVHSVTEWLERRATLRRPFVENYQPRHRADSPAG